MDEQAKEQAFINALVAQHYDLRSAASATIAESSSRASLYVLALSSSLVALGFTAQRPGAFSLFAAAVLPSIFLLGIFTFVRVVDTGLENLIALRSIVRIRTYYSGLAADAGAYFDIESAAHDTGAAKQQTGHARSWYGILFTTGTMIATINSIVGGVGVTMVLNAVLGPNHLVPAVVAGCALTTVLVIAAVVYQWRRFLAIFA